MHHAFGGTWRHGHQGGAARPGDFFRAMQPDSFKYLNGNKELVSLNLKTARGREVFLRLAADCDAVVEGFRPGVAARLGVDFDAAAKANPSIVYCSISGYGHSGPSAGVPGHDLNYMGASGMLSISGDPASNKPEYPHGPQVSDLAGSLFAANSILAALLGRGPDSGPRFLDVSLAESAAMIMMPRYLEFLFQGRPSKEDFMTRGAYGVYQAADGKYLALGIVEDHFWDNFCREAGLEELASDPGLRGWHARNKQARRLRPILEKVFKTRDRDQWLEVLVRADVPVSAVHDLNQWRQDPQFLARGFFPQDADDARPMDGLPRYPVPQMGRQSRERDGDMPVGRDTEKWLSAIGVEQERIDALRADGVI